MKRVLIVYDTKHGSTKKVSEWVKQGVEAKGVGCVVKHVSEVTHLGYDAVIIGSPIYYEKPTKLVTGFLSRNQESLKNRVVGVFVVCMTDFFEHLPQFFLKRLINSLGKEPDAKTVFGGELEGISRLNEKACNDFGKKFRELL
ncbi:MAG: hypothetical protein GOU97_05025 [Nanoarchaeota archaeon]|nr:hypothetical protein [Nanoarchaeota archaeon]